MHLDPEIYPNPTIWDPDNFLPDVHAQRPKGSFVPFSAGLRGCAGKCAKIIAKIIIKCLKISLKIENFR